MDHDLQTNYRDLTRLCKLKLHVPLSLLNRAG